jgi:hypothetical protein
MASVSRQIGWSQESNLLYQILKQITKLTAVVFALKPKYKVYTALVSQTGASDPQTLSSGAVTKGVTYRIDGGNDGDFSNVGAPSNEDSTSFIATINGEPNSYGSCALLYDTGAPTVIVLENTIGNIWFEYRNVGEYRVWSNSLFIEDKTAVDIDAFSYLNIGNYSFIANQTLFPESNFDIVSTISGGPTDNLLTKNRLEIKVYN